MVSWIELSDGGSPITRTEAEQLLTRPFAAPGVRVYRSGMVVSAVSAVSLAMDSSER